MDPDGHRQIILIDIEKEIAAQIINLDLEYFADTSLIGWMVSPP